MTNPWVAIEEIAQDIRTSTISRRVFFLSCSLSETDAMLRQANDKRTRRALSLLSDRYRAELVGIVQGFLAATEVEQPTVGLSARPNVRIAQIIKILIEPSPKRDENETDDD